MTRCKIGATLVRLRPCTKHSAKPSLGLEARATDRLTFFLSLQWRCRQLSGSLMMMAIPFQAVIDIDDSLGFSLRTSQASSWQSMTRMARPHGLRRVAKRASDQGGPHNETNAPSQPASFTAHMTASPGKLQWSNGEQWSREMIHLVACSSSPKQQATWSGHLAPKHPRLARPRQAKAVSPNRRSAWLFGLPAGPAQPGGKLGRDRESR